MVIIRYKTNKDMDVYFPQYDWTFYNTKYITFKKGEIFCPYERRFCRVGYLGEGKYKMSEKGKYTRTGSVWTSMLNRCYNEKLHIKHPSYKKCHVSEEFHNFQNFGDWDNDNYYEIEGERMHLDKDILIKHNKIYSPETCIYVPQTINGLFTKRDKGRGESYIGTSPLKNGKYQVNCCLLNPETGKSKNEYLGLYETQEKGFEIYKYYKERNIKQVADYYKNVIPQELYQAMYFYEVEIDD